MAIYGAGSVWDMDIEEMGNFFGNNNFVLGWSYGEAEDLYGLISSVKIGDIIYLKSKSPSSSKMNIKAIGIVTQSLVHYLIANRITPDALMEERSLAIGVRWVVKTPFELVIEEVRGKLTTIRPSSFYEEFLPCVQHAIIDRLTSQL